MPSKSDSMGAYGVGVAWEVIEVGGTVAGAVVGLAEEETRAPGAEATTVGKDVLLVVTDVGSARVKTTAVTESVAVTAVVSAGVAAALAAATLCSWA